MGKGHVLDLTGTRIGAWTVLQRVENDRHGFAVFECRCACGEIRPVQGRNLRDGVSLSCGCMNRQQLYDKGYIPELIRRPKIQVEAKPFDKARSIEKAWRNMMDRCYNPSCAQYKNYGARGITVCEEWHNLMKYAEDNINRILPGMTINRIDNDGNYSLENTNYVSAKEQARNRRNTLKVRRNGIVTTIGELAESFDIDYMKLYGWLKKGFMGYEFVD